MAILQASKVTSGTEQMPGVGDGQSAKCIASTYTFSVAPSAGDVIQSSLIQTGSVITDVAVVTSGLGTSGTGSIGYGVNAAYHAATQAMSASGVYRMSVGNIPLVLTTNDTIDLTVVAAGASATGTVTIIVWFTPLNA